MSSCTLISQTGVGSLTVLSQFGLEEPIEKDKIVVLIEILWHPRVFFFYFLAG